MIRPGAGIHFWYGVSGHHGMSYTQSLRCLSRQSRHVLVVVLFFLLLLIHSYSLLLYHIRGKSPIMPRPPLIRRITLSSFVLGFLASIVASRSCYFPNGNLAVGDTPCRDEAASACCGPDAICLTNGLCISVQQPYVIARGSCTDDSWQSSDCPNRCKNGQFSVTCDKWRLSC